jgi:hypothetical protein
MGAPERIFSAQAFIDQKGVAGLSVFGSNRNDRLRKLAVRIDVDRLEDHFCTWRIIGDREPLAPCLGCPDRPRAKPSAAVWANILQNRFDALPAKRTFESANHCLDRVRRQAGIAMFTPWS